MKTLAANKYNQQGFTIIELVIVILVIGILSAVALPRMIDLTTQARKSALLAIQGNFSTSVELLRSQWIAENKPDSVTNMDNQLFFIGADNTVGSIMNIGNAKVATADFAATDCISLWEKLLRNPPKTSSDNTCLTNNTCKFYTSVDASKNCVYQDKDLNTITYDRTTGTVTSSLD